MAAEASSFTHGGSSTIVELDHIVPQEMVKENGNIGIIPPTVHINIETLENLALKFLIELPFYF